MNAFHLIFKRQKKNFMKITYFFLFYEIIIRIKNYIYYLFFFSKKRWKKFFSEIINLYSYTKERFIYISKESERSEQE